MSGVTPPPPPPPPPVGPPPPPAGGYGAPFGTGGASKPQDWTVLAIVATVVGLCTSCFGLITGIVAIVFASKSKKLWQAGDIAGAQQASNNARIWLIVTGVIIVVGIIVNAIRFASSGSLTG
jgi:hypothetical protein